MKRICSKECEFCDFRTVGHGDMRWECVIRDYQAPLGSECLYSSELIEKLSEENSKYK